MRNTKDTFFASIMEKVSLSNQQPFSKTEFLAETCQHFHLSQGFIYEVTAQGTFTKQTCFAEPYAAPLADCLDLTSQLGIELLSELSSQQIVIYTGDTPPTPLTEKLKVLFHASTVIFIPILNQYFELAGFVGLCDRRSMVRDEEIDLDTSSAVLSLLAHQLKLELFQKGIASTERVLNNVLDHLGVDVYVNDYYTHDILYVNKSMAAPYGGIDNMMGKKCWQAIFTDKEGPCEFCPQPKLLDETMQPNKTYSWDYERAMDGSWFRVLSSSIPWTDGRVAHLVASVDITENKQNELLIQQLAQFDYLTGLPNRRSLEDDMASFTQENQLFAESFYLLFCDLDGFKKINDSIGHHCGDKLLQAISEALKAMPRDCVRAYRHGGDEFVILVKDDGTLQTLSDTLDQLFAIFCDTYRCEGHTMQCGCSIGVAHFPTATTTPKELFHLADTAMYAAKDAGKGVARFAYEDEFLTLEEFLQVAYQTTSF